MSDTIVHPYRRGTARRTLFGYLTEEHPRLDRIQNAISLVCGVIAAGSIVLLTGITLAGVVARAVFRAPLEWSFAFNEQYLLTATAFFGFVTAYRGGAHVAVASLFERLGPVPQKVLLIFGYIVAVVGMVAIAIPGFAAAAFSFTTGEAPVPGSSELPIPSWLWRSIVPVSMTLGVVVVGIDLLREVFSPWTGPTTNYDPGDEIDRAVAESEASGLAISDAKQAATHASTDKDTRR